MNSSSRTLLKAVAWMSACMLAIVIFHLGDANFVLRVGQFSPVVGAFTGGSIALTSVLTRTGHKEQHEPWIGYERLGWLLIGCGVIMWGFGESFWRYYISMGQQPFPSYADFGYSAFPIFIFVGLLLQPASGEGAGHKQTLLLLDSLVSMGSILAIAWFLLLGSLAQAPGEANLAKFLGLYYPIADTALLSCVVFLLLRGSGRTYQATARRTSLMVLGAGLCFFVFSDFVFNVQNNAGSYVEATWLDLGWPLGMLTIGLAAHMRRFIPVTSIEMLEVRMQLRKERMNFGPAQLLPYILLGVLLIVLSLNVLSVDPGQRAIRPVLLIVTFSVVALVVVRQILTLRDNIQLAKRQAEALANLEKANRRIEEQSRQIALHSTELELGIEHLKDVQANLANGNLRVRAKLTSGELLPLAASLNLMGERLIRLWQTNEHAQKLTRALGDLSTALERHWSGNGFVIPDSCNDLVEVNRLLIALRLRAISHPSDPVVKPVMQRAQSMPTSLPTPLPTPRTQSNSRQVVQEKMARFQAEQASSGAHNGNGNGRGNGYGSGNGNGLLNGKSAYQSPRPYSDLETPTPHGYSGPLSGSLEGGVPTELINNRDHEDRRRR